MDSSDLLEPPAALTRLPRALPVLPLGATMQPPGRVPFSPRDLLTAAFRHRAVVATAFLLPLLAGVAAGMAVGRQSTAESLLIVLPDLRTTAAADIVGSGPMSPVDAAKAARSEADIMQSQGVAALAAQRLGAVAARPSIRDRLLPFLAPTTDEATQAAAAARLRRVLHVWSDPTSNILRVTFSAPTREDAEASLRALIGAYFDHRHSVFRNTDASLLAGEVAGYSDRLREVEGQIVAVEAEHQVLNPTEEIRILSERLDQMSRFEDQLQGQRAAALASLESARRGLASEPQSVVAAREVSSRAQNDDTRNALLRLEMERAHMVALRPPESPQMQELKAKIDTARSNLADSQSARVTTTREVRNPSLDVLGSREVAAGVDADALDHQIGQVAERRRLAEARATEVREADRQLRPLLRKRDALEAAYRQFAAREATSRLQEEAEEARSANVHVVQEPTAAPAGLKGMLELAFAALTAGAVAAASAVLALAALRRVPVRAEDAEAALGLRLLASFPQGHPAEGGAAARDAAGLAAALLDAAGRSRVVAQFFPAEGADGAGPARATAVQLARGFGQRTLLVDLGGPAQPHLDALGRAPEGTAAQPTGAALPTGTSGLWVASDAVSAGLSQLHAVAADACQALDLVSASFDVAILVASGRDDYASLRLGALVDVNVMVVRAERTRCDRAALLRDRITAAGGNLLGFAFTDQRQILPAALEASL